MFIWFFAATVELMVDYSAIYVFSIDIFEDEHNNPNTNLF